MARTTDLQALADLVVTAVLETLRVDGIELDLAATAGSTLVPLRARGDRNDVALRRTLDHGGRLIGELRVWAPAAMTGETLAALDLLVPWLATAFGTAVLLAREHRLRRELEATMLDVLAAHPCRVFVLTGDGETMPGNDRARQALESGGTAVLARVAEAASRSDDPDFDSFPVVVDGHIERIVVIERASGRTLGVQVKDAATRWMLTARQAEVLEHVALGLSNKEIAARLECAEVTVEKHLTRVFRAAGVDTRARLVAAILE